MNETRGHLDLYLFNIKPLVISFGMCRSNYFVHVLYLLKIDIGHRAANIEASHGLFLHAEYIIYVCVYERAVRKLNR